MTAIERFMAEVAITQSRIGVDDPDIARLMECVRVMFNVLYAVSDLEVEELECEELCADVILKATDACEKVETMAMEGLEKYINPEEDYD